MTAKFCMICGKEVAGPQGATSRWEWAIDGAVIGERIELRGHKICLENLDNLVVIPNRLRLIEIITKLKEELHKLSQAKEKDIMEFLKSLEATLKSDPGKD